MAHPDEIRPLRIEGGFETLDLLAAEALVCRNEKGVNEAPEELHEQWLDLLYRLAREASILAAGGHLLCVGERTGR